MSKAKATVFKEYNQAHNFIFPPNLDDLVPRNHLVRVVNDVVDQMDISYILSQYKGGGTSSFPPRMLVKVLLYGYSVKIYTGRRLASALRQDICFMWLAAFNQPDFRTINAFRSGRLKDTIEELFKNMLIFLEDHGYIRLENYFCDGSTFQADANRHKMVWKKSAQRYQEAAEQRCAELFKEIDALNRLEDKAYGSGDLEETGAGVAMVSDQSIAAQARVLNRIIATAEQKKIKRHAQSLKKKLSAQQGKIEKYKRQQATSGLRSGHSRTDTDATAMKMKNEEVLPAYNVLIGSEDQFITNYSVHQNPNDGVCFPDHVQQLQRHTDQLPDRVIADSIFGTEQNYELLEGKEIENLMKFPLYHKEQTKSYRDNPFNKDNFPYDKESDTYLCPEGRKLVFREERKSRNKNGYESAARLYECQECGGCPFAGQCKKSAENKNRTIVVNVKLEQYRQQARNNLGTKEGQKLKRQRGQEVESCFGDIKGNQGFRRFHLRGKEKVKAEFGLVAIAHNLKKIFTRMQLNAAKAA